MIYLWEWFYHSRVATGAGCLMTSSMSEQIKNTVFASFSDVSSLDLWVILTDGNGSQILSLLLVIFFFYACFGGVLFLFCCVCLKCAVCVCFSYSTLLFFSNSNFISICQFAIYLLVLICHIFSKSHCMLFSLLV